MRIKARAKINWALNVTSVREDGYHLLDMLVQRIDLCDELSITPCEDMVFESDDASVPMDKSNLVVKAAMALKTACEVKENAKIRLVKRIPSQAGLGGGSADAAAVLVGLNELWQTGLSVKDLAQLGEKLGADVPLCLYPGLMRVSGIGEKVVPLNCGKALPLIILQPDKGLSTADIFKRYDKTPDSKKADIEKAMAACETGDDSAFFGHCHNQLQRTAQDLLPGIQTAVSSLINAKADFAQMTGSGSCVFGVFNSKETALQAFEALKNQFPVCILNQTSID